MSEMDDKIVEEFLADSIEGLDRLDRDLIELEKDPASARALGRAFRTLHTIKGTCSFFGYARLERVAHAGEGLLARVRSGERAFDAGIASALLAVADVVRRILASIEATRKEEAGDDSELIERVERLHAAPVAARGGGAPANPAAAPAAPPEPTAGDPPAGGSAADALDASLEGAPGARGGRASVRVDVQLLDRLMNLVGELVLARNQVVQLHALGDPARVGPAIQHLSHITSRLQEEMMQTRMQPIAALWTRLPRIVHDAAAACGKDVRLEMEGTHTELDKTIVEAIRDPLTHLVRNAVDHGIEAPAMRGALGKPAQGRLRLRASHEGGQVVIEIEDDGAGLPLERIRQKAIERGLVSPARAASLGERELLSFVFVPGFSTANRVTNVSGRGVGMDVVRTNVERIGGSIDLATTAARGTTVRLKIPLTLAILPALLVRAGGESFAIPQANLVELLRVGGRDPNARIEDVHGSPLLRLRGERLPVLWLGAQLGGPPGASPEGRSVVAGHRPEGGPPLHVVLVASEGRRFALVVDDVDGTEEIVVKPLAASLRGLGAFAGATILGDGRLALILDLPGLVRRAALPAAGPADDAPAVPALGPVLERYLVAQLRERWNVAMPLAQVTRLERFPVADVETLGGQLLIRHGGRVLPLVSLEGLIEPGARPRLEGRTHAHAIVCTSRGRAVGLLVERVDDVVEEAIPTGSMAGMARPGIAGCIVVRGRITDLVDVEALLALRATAWPSGEVAA